MLGISENVNVFKNDLMNFQFEAHCKILEKYLSFLRS